MKIVDYIYSNSFLAESIRRLFISLKLYYPYNLNYMKKMRETKPKDMVDAQEFYSSNTDRIGAICSLLSDDKSVQTYSKLINMRQFYRKEDIPEHSYLDQYFPRDIKEFADNSTWGEETFVDCGAFNGDICVQYAKRAKTYKKIYAFEPDRRNSLQLINRNIANLEVVEAACSDIDGTIRFCESEQSGGSHITEDAQNSNEVPCVKLDSVITDRVDFIKMDIEGAEIHALKGAEQLIKKNHPKLAISIYHSNEDMLDIPEYIHSIVPEYRMYVRAHTMGIAETILYCVE